MPSATWMCSQRLFPVGEWLFNAAYNQRAECQAHMDMLAATFPVGGWAIQCGPQPTCRMPNATWMCSQRLFPEGDGLFNAA
ncbi:hypothetical protein [Glaciecola sp. MF2-115]|uniref:hypothetical protein n=1 Tax=Glaciecola sp. MF2-115 TaxID=3384827 RepID=UPI0039A2E1C8